MTASATHPRSLGHFRKRGFTLTEFLISVVIILVLAMLTFVATQRMKFSAARTVTISQMRNIGLAASAWASDNNRREPFYYSNGTGDHPHEFSGRGKINVPGNPAKALYNSADPDAGYLRNPSDFFSPLVMEKTPERKGYDPAKASSTKIWGTYTWYFPFVSSSDAARYPDIGSVTPSKVNPRVTERFMMSESYTFSTPRFGKHIYHALMVDNSVRLVAESEAAFAKWKLGD
jgi:prepilin-type N-terminal cleavage/methylation domain-containing protein